MISSYKIGAIETVVFYALSIILFGSGDFFAASYLMFCSICILIFGGIGASLKIENPKLKLINFDKMDVLLLIAFFIAALKNVVDLLKYFDINDPVNVKNIFTDMALDQSQDGNFAVLILYLIGFPSVFFAAKRHALSGLNYYSAIVLICLVAPSLVTFSRLQMVVNLLVYYFSFASYKKMSKADFYKSIFKFFSMVMFVFVMIMSMRFVGDGDESVFNAVVSYIFGGFSAFSQVFDGLISNSEISGTTFFGLNSWLLKLGVEKQLPDLHLPFVVVGDSVTNVYTAYRHLIVDFGILGSIAFVSVLAFLGGLSFRNMNGSECWLPVNVMIATYFSLLFYTSAFVDSRVLVGVLISSVLMAVKK